MKNDFMNKILLLLTGNSIAQLILFASSPILTRIYTPEDFGVFATYTSLLAILMSFSSLCLEKAIPLEKNHKNTVHLMYISLFTIAVVCMLNIILSLLNLSLFQIYGIKTTIKNDLLLSSGLFFAGIYQVLLYWLVKEDKFKGITHSKILQSISNVISQFSLTSINHLTPGIGLATGDMIGRGITLVYIWRFFLKQMHWPKVNFRRIRYLFKKYEDFAKYSTWSTLLSSLSMQIIFLLLMRLYGPEVTGYFSMASKTVGLPITMVGASISPVFYTEALKSITNDPRRVLKLYRSILAKLAMAGIPSLILLAWIAPGLFSFVFGEEWRVSGEYVTLMSFMFISQVIVIPISQILYLIKKQRTQLLWDVSRLLLSSIGVLVIFISGGSAETAILYYSICMGASYYFFALLGYRAIHSIDREDNLKK
ncbi:oligosaccharide flippase family protein [Peribacillus sp. ACCC06369]|uniref:oligosaccharide flippase family protein n=1 Tax=Peribacillus sp. ACCC06369 TaxID=3055860 RepID=UPI0025A2A092|nr:oligosaccharide flippase family protein [Peribacillus sp. ACCC06369]MDM5361451.1 oligosaccharide flippase family protein [Peribacillus sp. ACCC06369]